MLKYEVRHEKTDLKVFVIVIPKEGLAGKAPKSPNNPSFSMTLTIDLYTAAQNQNCTKSFHTWHTYQLLVENAINILHSPKFITIVLVKAR